jgi:hypothetical protein
VGVGVAAASVAEEADEEVASAAPATPATSATAATAINVSEGRSRGLRGGPLADVTALIESTAP